MPGHRYPGRLIAVHGQHDSAGDEGAVACDRSCHVWSTGLGFDPATLSRVLVLLPPSRGKASPDHGRRAGLSTLVYPRLREPRERLIDAVDPGLRTAPAIRAAELYTGVLFAALGLMDLPWDGVLISSALWGVVRPGDRIPAYRLEMSAKPGGIASSVTDN